MAASEEIRVTIVSKTGEESVLVLHPCVYCGLSLKCELGEDRVAEARRPVTITLRGEIVIRAGDAVPENESSQS